MCRLWNIAMRDYQESVTTWQTQRDGQTEAGQSDPYVSPFNERTHGETTLMDILYIIKLVHDVPGSWNFP